MNFRFLFITLLISTCVYRANAQEPTFKDDSERLLEQVRRQLLFPAHPQGLFLPRFSLDIAAETISFEYAGTTAKEIRSLNEDPLASRLDTSATKKYPSQEKINWGKAKLLDIGKGWGYTKKSMQKIDAIYGHHDKVMAFAEEDVNANGVMDYICVRRVDSPTVQAKFHIRDTQPEPGYEVAIFEASPGNLTLIARLYLPEYTRQIVYYTNRKDRRLNIVSYQVFDPSVGAYQIGVDSIFW